MNKRKNKKEISGLTPGEKHVIIGMLILIGLIFINDINQNTGKIEEIEDILELQNSWWECEEYYSETKNVFQDKQFYDIMGKILNNNRTEIKIFCEQYINGTFYQPKNNNENVECFLNLKTTRCKTERLVRDSPQWKIKL